MTIRFLQTVQSENPEFPFVAGQVIDVPVPSPFLLNLLDGVHAEAVKDEDERAVAPETEQPEPVPVRRRRRRKHVA
jgi:hypothetical protein